MCQTNLRPLFWAACLVGVAIISIFADWTGGTFWAVFFGIIAMNVADQNRLKGQKGC